MQIYRERIPCTCNCLARQKDSDSTGDNKRLYSNYKETFMRVLVACEESQVVAKAFRDKGHEAYSCDVQPCSGGFPEIHLQGDVSLYLQEDWDIIIAFPPCTHLCVSGARWWKEKRKDGRQQQGIDFFMKFVNCLCPRIAIENPIGLMSTYYRKPDQIIQPWQFGHGETKATCLWLKIYRL